MNNFSKSEKKEELKKKKKLLESLQKELEQVKKEIEVQKDEITKLKIKQSKFKEKRSLRNDFPKTPKTPSDFEVKKIKEGYLYIFNKEKQPLSFLSPFFIRPHFDQ